MQSHNLHGMRMCYLGWVKMRQLNFVVSGPKFTKSFSSNVVGIIDDNAVSRLSMHVLAPFFSGGGGPKFWDLYYKIELTSDQVAKFYGDRPTELGDLEVKNGNKRKKETAVKHKTAGNCRSGRPNNKNVTKKIKENDS